MCLHVNLLLEKKPSATIQKTLLPSTVDKVTQALISAINGSS